MLTIRVPSATGDGSLFEEQGTLDDVFDTVQARNITAKPSLERNGPTGVAGEPPPAALVYRSPEGALLLMAFETIEA